MTRAGSSRGLVLLLLILSAVVVVELQDDFERRAGSEAVREDAVSVTQELTPAFALPERVELSETVSRPLFTPGRRAPEAPSVATPVPTARAARPQANRFALTAIVLVDDERLALMTDTTTGSLARIREGESIAGWRLEKIEEGSAELSNGDIREVLLLRHFAPPSRSPALPARRSGTDGTAADRSLVNGRAQLTNRPRRPPRSGAGESPKTP